MPIIIKVCKKIKNEKPKKLAKPEVGANLNPIANCVRAAGAGPASILLYRIRYWMPYARIEKLNEKWIVKPRAEWAADTGLSLDQYDRAIKLLKDKALVVCQQMPWNGDNVTHVRIPPDVMAKLDERPAKATQAKSAEIVETVKPTGATPRTTKIQETAKPKKQSWAEFSEEVDALIETEKAKKAGHAVH